MLIQHHVHPLHPSPWFFRDRSRICPRRRLGAREGTRQTEGRRQPGETRHPGSHLAAAGTLSSRRRSTRTTRQATGPRGTDRSPGCQHLGTDARGPALLRRVGLVADPGCGPALAAVVARRKSRRRLAQSRAGLDCQSPYAARQRARLGGLAGDAITFAIVAARAMCLAGSGKGAWRSI